MINETMTLAQLRKSRGFSQAQVARAMGRSETTVIRMEQAYPHVMYDRLREYLRAIGMDCVFTGSDSDEDIWADNVVNDLASRGAVEKRRNDPGRGVRVTAAQN